MLFSALLTVLCLDMVAANVTQVFFNSSSQCGHRDENELWYNVEESAAFNVLVGSSPDQSGKDFRNCEMVFGSSDSNGRLCVYQRKLTFDNYHITLELYDGYTNDTSKQKANKTITQDYILEFVEWCTTQRFLTIKLMKSGPRANLKDIRVDLLLYNMRGYLRKATMDKTPSCGSTFILDKSRVIVSNIDPALLATNIFPNCNINFEYVGQEEKRSVCLVFMSRDPTCSKVNYTLSIYQTIPDPDTGKMKSILAGTRSCKQPEPRMWCSNSTKLSLELWRHVDMVTTEKDVVFSVLVFDHTRDVFTLEAAMRTRTQPTISNDPHSTGASYSSFKFKFSSFMFQDYYISLSHKGIENKKDNDSGRI